MSDIRNKEKMAPVAVNRRESLSFDAILDNTDPEKLVQLIREKRGLRNAKRIFSETAEKANKRKSFPFEIQRNEPTTPPPVESEPVATADENSLSEANPKAVQTISNTNNTNNKQNDKNVDSSENLKRVSQSRVSVKRLSHKLGRRVLLKTFENMQKDCFCPEAVSTPFQRTAPIVEFASDISEINRCSSDEASPKLSEKDEVKQDKSRKSGTVHQPENISLSVPAERVESNRELESITSNGNQRRNLIRHHKDKSNRKTETIKQPKTITESLMCQSLETHHQNPNAEQRNAKTRTQVYEDDNDIDETLIGANSKVNVESESGLIGRTLVNEDVIEVHKTRMFNLENCNNLSKNGANPSVSTANEINQRRSSTNPAPPNKRSDVSTDVPVKHSAARISQTNLPSTNRTTSARQSEGASQPNNLFAAVNRTTSELVSSIVNKIRGQSKEHESNILAPPSPFRTINSPRKTHEDSLTIPPTQSPQRRPILMTCAKSPVVVVPYCRGSCHHNQSNHPSTTLTCPSCEKHASEKRTPGVLPENVQSTIGKNASQKNNIETMESQPSFAQVFQSEKSTHRKQTLLNQQPSLQRLEPEITSDEDASGDRLHAVESETNANNQQSKFTNSLSAYQSAAVDLRLSSRRSDRERLSLKPDKSRSRINTSKTRKSLNPQISSGDGTFYSDSGEISFDEVLKVESLLKKLNNSNKTSNSIPTGSTSQANVENNTKTYEYEEMQKERNPPNKDIMQELDENIIELVGREDAGNGFVYDLSPRLGRIYINSLFKNGEKRKTMTSRVGRPRRTRRQSPSMSQAVAYADIETSINKQIQSKKSRNVSCNIQNRRKLYSKENSENLSDDETAPYENTTHMHETTTFTSHSQQTMYDKKSKITKCRVRPESAKFFTIQQLKDKWVESDAAPTYRKHKRKKETAKTISDDDEYLFKVPQQPPPKRKATQSKVKDGKSASNIKKILGPFNESYNQDRYEGNHSSSSDDSVHSEISKRSSTNNNNEQQTFSPPSTCSVDVSKSSTNSKIDRLKTKGPNASVNQENQIVGDRNESFVSSRREFLPSSTLPAIQEVSISMNCDENVPEQEQPVEPEVASNKSTQKMRNSKTLSASKKRQTYSEHTQHDIRNKSGHSTSHSEETEPKLAEIRNISRKTSSKRSEISRPHETTQDELRTPSNKEKKSSERLSKKKRIKSTEDNRLSTTMSTDTQGNSGPPLRRSARKHRAPRPYWTNRYIPNDYEEICYKDYPVYTKKKRKYSRLKSINEHPIELDDPAQHEEPKQVGDDLFDVVKELSLNKKDLTETLDVPALNTELERIPKKPGRKKKNTTEKITKVVAENNNNQYKSKESPSIDSGHGTDTHVEQDKSKNFLLAWLKNLVEPKTITSNPDLINIFEMNKVQIVPVNQLTFRELDGVEYAYYSKVTDGDNYGFIRFHPRSVKKKAKTKLFELRILNIVGELDLHIGNETGKLKNGDFVTVPKGIIYSISNTSDEIALIFFIKTR